MWKASLVVCTFAKQFNQIFLQHDGEPSSVAKAALGEVAPVSTTLECIINLTIQYLAIYTILALVRSYHEISGTRPGKVEDALKAAATSVTYAPALCVLFLGLRMRVLFLTKGEGNPDEWVQYCMYACSYAVLANTLLVLVIPVFVKSWNVEVDDTTGDLKADNPFGQSKDSKKKNPFENAALAWTFTALRYLVLLGLYGGFVGVVVGIVTFEPAKNLWPAGVPEVSAAVAAVVSLSVQYFVVYFFVALARSHAELIAKKPDTKYVKIMEAAIHTVNMAPMLCILFLAARMRALQMQTEPQHYAKTTFYCCAYALLAQTLFAVAVPAFALGQAEPDKEDLRPGDVVYKMNNEAFGKLMTVVRYIIMLCVYGGFITVIYSMLTLEHPDGPSKTPDMSPTLQCVMNLTIQFFSIYFILWVFLTVQDFTSYTFRRAQQCIEAARATVQYAPMLAILFVGTRMRALQITKQKGSPQAWAQDGMFMATWAIFIQFVMCLAMGIVSDKVETDKDGNVRNIPASVFGKWAVTIVRYIALLFLYGGTIIVMVSIFMITKETAGDHGGLPLADSIGVGKVPIGVDDAMKTVA